MMSHVLRRRESHRLIVTLKTGESFDGVLWAHDKQAIVLRNASAAAMGENGSALPLDGELIVLLADVRYVQRP